MFSGTCKRGITMKKKNNEQLINDFLQDWDCVQNTSFLRDLIPLLELYNVDEEDDWLKKEVGGEDYNNVRLIRTVYLISRFADLHAGKLLLMKTRYKDLWKRLETAS